MKVEVAVLGFPSLIVLMVSADVSNIIELELLLEHSMHEVARITLTCNENEPKRISPLSFNYQEG